MVRVLPSWLVGALSFVAFILNTLFWSPWLLLTALVRAVVPWEPVVTRCRRAATWVGEQWIANNVLGLRAGGRMRWHVEEPGDLRRNGWYLVTCNHRSWVDIVIVQWLFNRRIPLLKFFLKKELFWVPVLGLCWWALEFPFMRRYPRAVLEQRPDLRRRDLETTMRACLRFRHLPTCVLNFLEGTRFSEDKRASQGSPYAHLLLPRAGGFAQVVSSLGDLLDAILDVTIVYPAGTPTFWQLISGQIPSVRVHVARVDVDPAWIGRDYDSDPGFRESLQAFTRDLWAAKDARIASMVQSRG